MQINHKLPAIVILCFLGVISGSCKKLISIPIPEDTITTSQVFSSEPQAESALAGMYSRMINGMTFTGMGSLATDIFSAGAVTIMAGLSSDELYNIYSNTEEGFYVLNCNKLTSINSGVANVLWITAYRTIYDANGIIEGVAASTSDALRDSARKQLTGEAKFVRAFCYFYLTNLYGDLPLALTVDFNKTVNLRRASQQQVYQQIATDLKDAETLLVADYSTGKGERVRPNKWAATALLARTYLFMGDTKNASLAASAVIGHSVFFNLETDLNNVFRKDSREAIWQLKQTITDGTLKNATPEGSALLPVPLYHGTARFSITNRLLDAFVPGDNRRADWVDSTDNADLSFGITYYPAKYKTGNANGEVNVPAPEYYMMLRLAEMYLVRAEADANGGPGGLSAAITDLNTIRHRAGLTALPDDLTKVQVLAAIEKERQVELFAEWGHRWFDLKRTGRAHDVLSSVPIKQPWAGDYQLLYPIPNSEIRVNASLIQNPQY